jgi:hypothetical protein
MCRGCSVTARWADGQAHPEPKVWKAGLCLKCQQNALPPSSRPAPPAPTKPGPKPEPRPSLTADQRGRAAVLMREGKNNTEVATGVGGEVDQVRDLRKGLGIAHPNIVRGEISRRAALTFMAEHPTATVDEIIDTTGLSRGAILDARAEAKSASAAPA